MSVRYPPRRLAQVVLGCVLLGVGVAMLLTADLGSDGFSTLVNGVSIASGMSFLVANLLISLAFLLVAALRAVLPGAGTVIQVVVVGWTVSFLIGVLETPDPLGGRIALLAAAFPPLALGIAVYLGAHTGAGPAEAAALAWDPPVPFKWTYSVVQGGGALVGWLLGATIGVGTIAVILVLGPAVDLTSRLLVSTCIRAAAREPGPPPRICAWLRSPGTSSRTSRRWPGSTCPTPSSTTSHRSCR